MPNRKANTRSKQNKTQNFSNNRKVSNLSTTGVSAVNKRVTGSEHLATLQIHPTDEENATVQSFANEARTFQDMRVSKFFEMYERWFVRHITLEWVPSLPVTTPGTIHVSPEYDAMDVVSASDREGAIIALSRMYGYKSAPITEGLRVRMANYKLPSGRWLFDDLFTSPISDERFTTFGKFLIVMDTPNPTSTTTAGRLLIHYDIEFAIPQLADIPAIEDLANFSVYIDSSNKTLQPQPSGPANSSAFSMHTMGGLVMRVTPDTIIRALTDQPQTTGIPRLQYRDELLPPGTPVYMRPVTYDTISGSYMGDPSAVGAFSLDRDFTQLLTVLAGEIPNDMVFTGAQKLFGTILS